MEGGRGIGNPNNKNLKRLQTREEIDIHQVYNQNGCDDSRYNQWNLKRMWQGRYHLSLRRSKVFLYSGFNQNKTFPNITEYFHYESSHYIENLDIKSFFISVIYYSKSDNQKPTRFILWYMKIKGMYYSNLFILILLTAYYSTSFPYHSLKGFKNFRKNLKFC